LADDDGHWVVACARARLDEAPIVCSTVAGQGILIVRDGDAIVACDRACPHEQADLSRGHVDHGRLHCAHHRASFSLATGAISAGWPSAVLRRFPVRLDDSWVWVDVKALVAP
jgi:3-phenylpropionate/trans-cinnamate dioxygenase ferredoxin subunit